MILDELVLHDFGIYAGQQSIKLTPPAVTKPITMFYGLNGAGKTTILESIQIALFGQFAPFLRNKNYHQYISHHINKYLRHGQASLRLDFHRSENGQITQYRIYRVWKKKVAGVTEKLDIIKNGHKSKTLALNWHQYVEEIISPKLAHFFFFDGENIEEYASEKGVQQLLSTGLYTLLGLDLLSRSKQDMIVLQQRKLSENIAKSDDIGIKNEIAKKKEEVSLLERKKEEFITERASIQTHEVDVYQRQLDKLNESYKSIGGNFWEHQEQTKNNLLVQQAQQNKNDELIREAISGVLPLALVRDWFSDIEQYKQRLEAKEIALLQYTTIKGRDQQTLSFLKELGGNSQLIKKLSKVLDNSYVYSPTIDADSCPFKQANELDGFDKATLEAEIDEASAIFNQRIKNAQKIAEQIDLLNIESSSIPDSNEIETLIEEKRQIENKLSTSIQILAHLDKELDNLKDQINKINDEINMLMRNAISLKADKARTEKYIQRLDDVSNILQSFSKSILKSKIEDIEKLILDSYQILLHKENLLEKISIDSETLHISLCRKDGHVLANNQLSAGERQLLSISVLWGLAKASSKPFPVAVDTPFGRLDSMHRMKLAANYFTRASHQILLFSTDEEIVDEYFDVIKSSIGWIYKLDYDNEQASTKIRLDNVSS